MESDTSDLMTIFAYEVAIITAQANFKCSFLVAVIGAGVTKYAKNYYWYVSW